MTTTRCTTGRPSGEEQEVGIRCTDELVPGRIGTAATAEANERLPIRRKAPRRRLVGAKQPAASVELDGDGLRRPAAALEEEVDGDGRAGTHVGVGGVDGLAHVAPVHPLTDPDAIQASPRRIDRLSCLLVTGEQLTQHAGERPALPLVDVALIVLRGEGVEVAGSRPREGRTAVGEDIAYRPPRAHGGAVEGVGLGGFEDGPERHGLHQQDVGGGSHSVERNQVASRPMTIPAPSETARRIHAGLPVVDGHNDLPWAIRTKAGGSFDVADPSQHLPGFHTDIPRLLAGGVGAQFWSVYVPADIPEPHRETLAQIDLVERIAAHDHRLRMARTAADVHRVRAEGQIACLMGAEGGHAIENSLGKLEVLASRGVRYMTLTHSDTIDWADSATDDARHGGLTDFGRRVVRMMNRLGMLVDVSHVSVATMRDALDASEAPVIASHSNAAALAPHPRNIPDEILATIGSRGGVVMAVFFPGFVIRSTAETMIGMFGTWREVRRRLAGDEKAIAAEMDRIEAGMELAHGTVSDVVDHVEHIADVAGIDSVGLGSDFDGMTMTPEGLGDVSCYPAITDELLRRSWSETEIRKVLGDNSLRVLEAAEAAAGPTANR